MFYYEKGASSITLYVSIEFGVAPAKIKKKGVKKLIGGENFV